jgi:hypothetical protein
MIVDDIMQLCPHCHQWNYVAGLTFTNPDSVLPEKQGTIDCGFCHTPFLPKRNRGIPGDPEWPDDDDEDDDF